MRRSKEEAAAEALVRSLCQDHGAAMMAMSEAAAVLNIPQGTVKSRTFQAIRMLRKAIRGTADLVGVS